MYKKVILLMLSIVSGCCVAEPTRAEQEVVEAAYLQDLIDKNMIVEESGHVMDGLQVVLEAVEEILPALLEQNGDKPMFCAHVTAWKIMIDIAYAQLSVAPCLPGELCADASECAVVEWVKSGYVVPLERVARKKGFVSSFELFDYFYRNLVLVYPFEFESAECDASLAQLRRYIQFTAEYLAKRSGKRFESIAALSPRLCGRGTPYGSSPKFSGSSLLFVDVAGVGLVFPKTEKGIKGRRGEERSYAASVKAEASFDGCGAGSPILKKRCGFTA